MIPPHDSKRRSLLGAALAGVVLGAVGGAHDTGVAAVTDVAQLESMPVAEILQPRATDQVAAALRRWKGAVSIGDGRYSMGGQIAAADSLHLDTRALAGLIHLDVPGRVVRCQAGMRWRDLLDHIDPHDLSMAIMQSYSNFTLGGSLSVNCHGRYVGKGALVNSVRAVQLVTADGAVLELSRTQQPEVFAAVVGGYGGLGVVTEIELDLDVNAAMQRPIERIALRDYPSWFEREVLVNPDVLMHSADLAHQASMHRWRSAGSSRMRHPQWLSACCRARVTTAVSKT